MTTSPGPLMALDEEHFRRLVEGIRDFALITLDPEGRIASWNNGATRIHGYSDEDVLGRNYASLFAADEVDASTPGRVLEQARASGRAEDEGWRLRKDGELFWANMVVTSLPGENGTPMGFLLVTRDLTARKQAELKAQAFAARLEQSNRELQEFASVASHDLQEPLRKIQAFGGRLSSRCGAALDTEGKDYLGRMLRAADRMRVLIDDLLAFSRVTTKAQPFARVDLGRLAADVVGDLEELISRTGGRVELGPLPTVYADAVQMQQLLQNLIGNGLKFHRPDVPPVIVVRSSLLPRAAASPEGPRPPLLCRIEVEDNGIGFDEKYLDRIFNVFQRLHGLGEYEGTGVGLAICRKIAERHGGSITASSQPGRGATFLVTLPVEQRDREFDR